MKNRSQFDACEKDGPKVVCWWPNTFNRKSSLEYSNIVPHIFKLIRILVN